MRKRLLRDLLKKIFPIFGSISWTSLHKFLSGKTNPLISTAMVKANLIKRWGCYVDSLAVLMENISTIHYKYLTVWWKKLVYHKWKVSIFYHTG